MQGDRRVGTELDRGTAELSASPRADGPARGGPRTIVSRVQRRVIGGGMGNALGRVVVGLVVVTAAATTDVIVLFAPRATS